MQWKGYILRKTCTQIFTAALFTILAQSGNNPKATRWWMNKQNVVHPQNRILFSPDTCYCMDEPRIHYALWKKSDTKRHIPLCFSLYQVSRIGKYRDRRYSSSCQGLGEGQNEKWGDETILKWDALKVKSKLKNKKVGLALWRSG